MNNIIIKSFLFISIPMIAFFYVYTYLASPLLNQEPDIVLVIKEPPEEEYHEKLVKVLPGPTKPVEIPDVVEYPKTYYTRIRITETTCRGISAIPKGVRLETVMQRSDGLYDVTYGNVTITTTMEAFTDDIGEIDKLVNGGKK